MTASPEQVEPTAPEGAEEFERARMERVRLITDAMPVLIGYVDTEQRYRFLNRAYREWFGRSRRDMIGRRIVDVVGENGYATIRPFAERALSGERVSYETEMSFPDGRSRVIAATYVPHQEGDGPVLGFFSLVNDLTERKRAEDSLRLLAEAGALLADSLDYEATLRRVADLCVPRLADTCVIDMLDELGRLQRLAVSPAGRRSVDWIWEVAETPLDPDARHGPAQVIRTGRSELIAAVTDAHLVTSARNERHLEMLRRSHIRSHMIVPLRARGRTLGTVTFVTTRTRTYGAEDLALAEELAHHAALAVDNARLYREAQSALRMRDEFLSNITHDLRTPLTSIKGRAQLLQRQVARGSMPAPETLADGLAAIASTTDRMNALVGELIDLARLEDGRPLELARESVDLVALARRCAAEYERAAGAPPIRVSAVEGSLCGQWDPVRLERVMDNLISNAVRYGSGGEIRIDLGRDGDAAILTVADRGVGIPAADLPRIFERFHRGSNVSGRIPGAGVGLAGVKQIVEQHGGSVTVESEEGRGTTMTVRLPLAPPS